MINRRRIRERPALNLENELEIYESKGSKEVLESLHFQLVAIRLKKYLFTVLKTIEGLEDKIKDLSEVLDEKKLNELSLKFRLIYNEREECITDGVGVVNKNKENINKSLYSEDQLQKISSIANNFSANLPEVNDEMLEHTTDDYKYYFIPLDKDMNTTLKQILLSDELRKTFDYTKLNRMTPNKNEEKEQRTQNRGKI